MSKLQVIYDDTQHCRARNPAIGKSVVSDACTATGGKGEELSPGDLVGAGLASCMLFSMGVLAVRDGLDLRGTRVDVDVSFGADRIRSVDLEFVLPQGLSAVDREKLERAASTCPVEHSFHPEIPITARFRSPEHASVS